MQQCARRRHHVPQEIRFQRHDPQKCRSNVACTSRLHKKQVSVCKAILLRLFYFSQDPIRTSRSGPKRPSNPRCESTERQGAQQLLCRLLLAPPIPRNRGDLPSPFLQALMPCSERTQLLLAHYLRPRTSEHQVVLSRESPYVAAGVAGLVFSVSQRRLVQGLDL